MSSFRNALILASLAGIAALPGFRGASADIIGPKDELASGDWHGVQRWEHVESSPAPAPTSTPTSTPPPSGGTPTPPPSGTPSSTTGTPTVPSGTNGGSSDTTEPVEPDPTGESDPTGEPGTTDPENPPAPDPDEPSGPPLQPPLPPAPPVPMTPAAASTCNARWSYGIRDPHPGLYEELTTLTITLFRTDVFAFICSGYCRSESTWYVDGFATTTAGHDGQTPFFAEIRLENACPLCQPKITLRGVSSLEAKVQAKTFWGGVNASTTASASATTSWAGEIDCGDRCSATIADGQGTGEISVGAAPLEITQTTNKSLIRVDAEGGRGDAGRVDGARTSILIVDRGSVHTCAQGTDDNAQAKCRVGYYLVMEGDSACGKWGKYEVNIKE